MTYKIKIIKPNQDEGMEVIFEINDHQYCAMGVTPKNAKIGDEIEVEIGFLDIDEISWDQMFKENPKLMKTMINRGGWNYDAYGEIVSINPVTVDIGDFNLEIGYISNDIKIIGEHIFFPITRLNIY